MVGPKAAPATLAYGSRPFTKGSTSPPNDTLHHDLALGETLAPPPPAASAAPGITWVPSSVGAVSATLPGRRTTVLPRVERIDQQLTLQHQGRHRYESAGVLGEGGCGVVEKVMDNDIGRTVAIKRLREDTSGPPHLARFVEEIQLVGRLEHPNIVPIHDVGEDGPGQYYFVMKYVDGETLETIITRLAEGDPAYHRRFSCERRVEIFMAVLQALEYAHGEGLVHRDLKPANIMVGTRGEVQVMDWGIARRIDDQEKAAEEAGQLIGTPLYMSPEQAQGLPIDERTDLYSACVLFHELLCLRHPLADKQSLEALLEGVRSDAVPFTSFVPSPHQPPAPAELSWFVRDGLQKDPALRFQSAAAMLARLRSRAEGEFPVRCPLTFSKRLARRWLRLVDRHPLLMTAVLATLLLGPPVALVMRLLR